VSRILAVWWNREAIPAPHVDVRICTSVNRFHRFPRWNEKAGFQRDALCSQ